MNEQEKKKAFLIFFDLTVKR